MNGQEAKPPPRFKIPLRREQIETSSMSHADAVDKVLEIARRRGFFWPAYEPYGGSAGLFVFGDLGVRLREKIEGLWRETFVRPHDFVEIDGPELMPEQVLEASGHVANFKDPLAECLSCHRRFRADHLLGEAGIHVQEGTPPHEMEGRLNEGRVSCPECGHARWSVKPFLTMFQTSIGPYGEASGYLRPETAQNIFVEFKRIFEVSRGRMPLGVAQVGRGFRNEISPRQSLVRMREFHMAEVELFFDPERPGCQHFAYVAEEPLDLVTEGSIEAGREEVTRVSAREALAKGIIRTEWLAYFMALSKLFLVRLGVPEDRQRFREKVKGERAHYSAQTFDHEVLIEGYGWVEVAGHAYRTDYDLTSHMKKTGVDYSVSLQLDAPRRSTKVVWSLDARRVKERHPNSWRPILEAYGKIGEGGREGEPPTHLAGVKLDPSVVVVNRKEEVISSKKVVPHVVEPSFGLDRLTLACMVYAYSQVEDRVVMKIPRALAPLQVGVFPLVAKAEMVEKAKEVQLKLEAEGMDTLYDDSGTIGRRYARADEAGLPLAVTVDGQTLEKGTVTVRDRDTWKQVTVGLGELAQRLKEMLS